MSKLNNDFVSIAKDDVGTICDVVEHVYQHSKCGTKKLNIALPSTFTLHNMFDGIRHKTWKDKILYADNWHSEYLVDTTFNVKKQGTHLIITF